MNQQRNRSGFRDCSFRGVHKDFCVDCHGHLDRRRRSTISCNYNLRELAVKVKEGIRAVGGTPMELNTIAISDGVTIGTEGMKISLVSREVIANRGVVARLPSRRYWKYPLISRIRWLASVV